MLQSDINKLATPADLLPIKTPEVTPLEWLAMLPGVVAKLEPAQHEEFVTKLLRALDLAGVEMAGCVCDEMVVARNWL
jgi:hypothetical protein